MKTLITATLALALNGASGFAALITTTDALVAAVRDGTEGSTIKIETMFDFGYAAQWRPMNARKPVRGVNRFIK